MGWPVILPGEQHAVTLVVRPGDQRLTRSYKLSRQSACQPFSAGLVPASVAQLHAGGEELDTRDVVSLSDLGANDESDDECRVYLIGRRSSPMYPVTGISLRGTSFVRGG